MRRSTQTALAREVGGMDGIGRKELYRDGNVPNVNFNDGKLYVNWYNRDSANDNLRSRQVIFAKSPIRGLFV